MAGTNGTSKDKDFEFIGCRHNAQKKKIKINRTNDMITYANGSPIDNLSS